MRQILAPETKSAAFAGTCAKLSHSGKRGYEPDLVRSFLVVAYAAATTIVIIVMPRLHVQVIAVTIYGCGMVIVVTASAISADAVRSIPVARIAAITDGKRAAGRIAAVADAKP